MQLGMCYPNNVNREVWRIAIRHISKEKNGYEHYQVRRGTPKIVFDDNGHVVRLWTSKPNDSVTSGSVAATLEALLATDWVSTASSTSALH
jgi:hypothetical protein